MPGKVLRVWRTDGLNTPVANAELRYIASHEFPSNKVIHLRHETATGAVRFDIIVEPLPPIPEVPASVAKEHE